MRLVSINFLYSHPWSIIADIRLGGPAQKIYAYHGCVSVYLYVQVNSEHHKIKRTCAQVATNLLYIDFCQFYDIKSMLCYIYMLYYCWVGYILNNLSHPFWWPKLYPLAQSIMNDCIDHIMTILQLNWKSHWLSKGIVIL